MKIYSRLIPPILLSQTVEALKMITGGVYDDGKIGADTGYGCQECIRNSWIFYAP